MSDKKKLPIKRGQQKGDFIFEQSASHSDFETSVRVATGPETYDTRPMGTLRCFNRETPAKRFYQWGSTRPEHLHAAVETISFETQEQAAQFLYVLIESSKEHLESNPLPEDVRRYLEDRGNALSEEIKTLTSRFHGIQTEMYILRKVGMRSQIPFIDWRTELGDGDKLVHNLLKLKVYVEEEKREVPFISEAALYHLVGKDAARSILKRVEDLCKFAAPAYDVTMQQNQDQDEDE